MPNATLENRAGRMRKMMEEGQPRPIDRMPKGVKRRDYKKRFVRRVRELGDVNAILRALENRAQLASGFRRDHEDKWHEAIRAWFQLPSHEEEDGWESDRFLPIILKQVETAVPAFVAATLDGNKIWKVLGMTRQGKNIARAQEALLNWQAYTTAGCEEAYEDAYWWAALLGTAVLDHWWDYRQETRMAPIVRRGPRGNPLKEVTEQLLTVADTPKVRCLNPWDVWLAPSTRMGNDGDWLWERVRTTVRDLQDAGEDGGHIDKRALEELLDEISDNGVEQFKEQDWFGGMIGETWQDILREVGHDAGRDEGEEGDLADTELTVLRYRSKGEIITLGSPRHIIGYSLNPFTHGLTGSLVHQFFKVPDSPYGRGLGTILLDHQRLANENINAYMDTAKIERAAPIIIDRTMVSILDDEFVLEPNKLIRARSTKAVERMNVPAPTNLAMLLDQHLQRDADDVTGFSEQARGMASQGGQGTATAFTGLQNNLRTRMILHMRRAARTLRLSGDMLLQLNGQFLTDTQVVAVTGAEGLDYVTIEPHEIVGKSVIRAVTNTSRAAPDLRAQRLLQLTQAVVPLMTGGGLQDPRIATWLRMLLEENDVEDVDLILPRNMHVAHDPVMENEALKRGARIPPNPAEDHMAHIQAHGALHEELLAGGAIGAASVVQEHIQAHLAMASEMMMGGGPPGGAAPPAAAGNRGGSGATSEAQGTAGAQARNGTPRVASPGPGAPPGRPMASRKPAPARGKAPARAGR